MKVFGDNDSKKSAVYKWITFSFKKRQDDVLDIPHGKWADHPHQLF